MPPLTNRQKTKLKYKSGNAQPDGPGVWCTCIRGKEKQVIGELTDVFESIADQLWPLEVLPNPAVGEHEGSDEGSAEEDLEKQLARELKVMKTPKRPDKRIRNVYIDLECLIFLSCAPPIEPVKLVLAYLHEIEGTKTARTRSALRLIPVVASCPASVNDISRMASRILPDSFEADPSKPYRYKIELKIHNNSKMKKDTLIPELAKMIPLDRGHSVDLDDPELVVLVEIYKGTCGLSVVPDWYRLKRFNVIELVQSVNRDLQSGVSQDKIGTGDLA